MPMHTVFYILWFQACWKVLGMVQDVWKVGFLSDSKKVAVSFDSKVDILVDGVGIEPTTPALRTRYSPN